MNKAVDFSGNVSTSEFCIYLAFYECNGLCKSNTHMNFFPLQFGHNQIHVCVCVSLVNHVFKDGAS